MQRLLSLLGLLITWHLLFMSHTATASPETQLPALHQAVIKGDLSKIKQLIASGTDINQLDPLMGNSPLHIAAQTDHTHIIEYLINHGAFINLQAPRSGFTPLMIAAWYSKAANIRMLFTSDELNLNVTTPAGLKADNMVGGWDRKIEKGEQQRYNALTQLFIEKRAQLDALLASQHILNIVENSAMPTNEKRQKITMWINKGEDVNQRRPVYASRNDWHTPLLIAARNGQTDIVKLLLKHGADQTIPGYPMNAIAFHKAAYMGHPDIISLLLADEQAPKVLNAQGPNNGYTPLHDAIWHGNTQAAQRLIDAGAKQDLKTYEQDTPKALAERYQYRAIASALDH